MKKLLEVLTVLAFVFLSVSGCETVGAEERLVEEPQAEVKENEESKNLTAQLLLYAEGEDIPKYEPVYTSIKSEDDEYYIWKELSRWSPNDQITAGIMGYFWKESFLRSDAVAGWDVRNAWHGQERDICQEFTEIIDAGLTDGSTKEYFDSMVRIHYGGYGLGQWLDAGYLSDLYDFIREREGSIGDAALQCEFIFLSLQKNEELWNDLLQCTTAIQVGRRMGVLYDGTYPEHAEAMADKADQYYKKYHTEEKE